MTAAEAPLTIGTGDGGSLPSLHPDELFVRVLALPTASAAKARAAVRLQMERLSPAPLEEIAYALAPLSTADGLSRWAVAFVRRERLAAVCQTQARSGIEVRKVIEGQDAIFAFSDPDAAQTLARQWAALLPHAAALAFALMMLLAVSHVRLGEAIAGIEEPGGARDLATRAVETAAARDVAGRSWAAAQTAPAVDMTLCVLRTTAGAVAGRRAIAALDARPGQARVTLVGAAAEAERLKSNKGVTVSSEAAGGAERMAIAVAPAACVEGR